MDEMSDETASRLFGRFIEQMSRTRSRYFLQMPLVSPSRVTHGFSSSTPKYLSKLVKSASGKSAHEWIDSFVILEAKNMLKYSGMSIKSIVWELNFPNQTTFYRFFKTQTGMTPSEYRKS